jgi:UDPglucose 6-dehydrogenase
MRIAFVPEFLRERAAFVDFVENHDLCVIGVGPGAEAAFATIKEAHGNLPRNVVKLSRVEAELCKYFGNVFNALRVVFANEFFEVAKSLGANYTAIKSAMVNRQNINDSYLDANESFRGFGGVCLPKDTAAFAAVAKLLCPHLKLFETIVEENRKFQVTVPDGMRP